MADKENQDFISTQPLFKESVKQLSCSLKVFLPNEIKTYDIGYGLNVIGRSESCRITIIDPSVSRQHCAIELTREGSIFIKDLHSLNKTFRNGVELRPQVMYEITDKTEIKIGQLKLLLSLEFGENSPDYSDCITHCSKRRSQDISMDCDVLPETQFSINPSTTSTPYKLLDKNVLLDSNRDIYSDIARNESKSNSKNSSNETVISNDDELEPTKKSYEDKMNEETVIMENNDRNNESNSDSCKNIFKKYSAESHDSKDDNKNNDDIDYDFHDDLMNDYSYPILKNHSRLKQSIFENVPSKLTFVNDDDSNDNMVIFRTVDYSENDDLFEGPNSKNYDDQESSFVVNSSSCAQNINKLSSQVGQQQLETNDKLKNEIDIPNDDYCSTQVVGEANNKPALEFLSDDDDMCTQKINIEDETDSMTYLIDDNNKKMLDTGYTDGFNTQIATQRIPQLTSVIESAFVKPDIKNIIGGKSRLTENKPIVDIYEFDAVDSVGNASESRKGKTNMKKGKQSKKKSGGNKLKAKTKRKLTDTNDETSNGNEDGNGKRKRGRRALAKVENDTKRQRFNREIDDSISEQCNEINDRVSIKSESVASFQSTESSRLRRSFQKSVIVSVEKPDKFNKIVSSLGGVITDCPDVATHFVTTEARRSVRFMSCLARGAYIVTPEWLNASKKAKNFQDCQPYILRNNSKINDVSLSQVIKTAQRYQTNSGGILAHYRCLFIITCRTKPDIDQLRQIILCGGGQCLSITDPNLSDIVNDRDSTRICIADESDVNLSDERIQLLVEHDIDIVNVEFLLTMIIEQKLPKLAEYRIIPVSK